MRRFSVSPQARITPILLAALFAFAMGCAGTSEPVEDTSMGDDSEFNQGRTPSMDSSRDSMAGSRDFTIAPVYFDLDSSSIRPQFESVLRGAAEALKSSGASVVIEGHCDDRGSDEYNVALGERRATAVRRYLYNLGVPQDQMSTVSYGEARPAVSGSGETAWQLNRRAEFRVR